MSEISTAAPQPGQSLRWLFLLPLVLFLGLAALFARQLSSGDPARLPSALIGKPVPVFVLPPVEGLRNATGQALPGLDAAALKGGGVTIVNVWASWCAPCRIEHPALMELARRPDLRIAGIAYKDKPEAARRFLALLGNPFSAVGADDTGRTAIEWGVYGVPETFVVGADGTIRHKHVGPITPESLPGFLDQVRKAAASPRAGPP